MMTHVFNTMLSFIFGTSFSQAYFSAWFIFSPFTFSRLRPWSSSAQWTVTADQLDALSLNSVATGRLILARFKSIELIYFYHFSLWGLSVINILQLQFKSVGFICLKLILLDNLILDCPSIPAASICCQMGAMSKICGHPVCAVLLFHQPATEKINIITYKELKWNRVWKGVHSATVSTFHVGFF